MTVHDRRAKVLASASVNGIDYVEIANATQTVLQVHFLNATPVEGTLNGPPKISGGESIPTVPVLRTLLWGWDDGHIVMTLRVQTPGDFSAYTLTLSSPVLDPFFDHAQFSFKANCPTDLDCQTPAVVCPPSIGNPPPIDYLAKDFLSFRQALLDFSALRYPSWQERSEADFGVMFLEALSAVADDLSYTQDRIAAESSLLTATQRRSAVRHARLVDYEPKSAVSASTWLQFDVSPNTTLIPNSRQNGPTVAALAQAPDGTTITFETGMGIRDASPPAPANALWNRSAPEKIKGYWFDDSEQCLPVGATHMHVAGHGWSFAPGQMLLIETQAQNPADPPVRQIVHLLGDNDPGGPPAKEICDKLFPSAVAAGGPPFFTCTASPPGSAFAPTAITRITWQTSDALTVARDLDRTVVIGNIANATQGRTVVESFVVGPPPPGVANSPPSAVERTGARPLVAPGQCGPAPTIRLHTLAAAPLAWLPQPTIDPTGRAVPEIVVVQTAPPVSAQAANWSWVRTLLDAQAFDQSFTIDPASYSVVATNSDLTTQNDYDGDGGDTIRFGDSVFGANPETGMQFAVRYRFGAGVAGNVAAGAVARLDPATQATGLFTAVDNPLPATGGADAQTLQSIRRLAPQAFQVNLPRAVLAADYTAAAQSQPWVKRAGTVFRWTGSWLTTFTTPEPIASEQIAIDDRISLIKLLNRYRMAGTECYVPDPEYVSMDLIIELCALANAFAAQVRHALIGALSPTGSDAASAFFAVSKFVFGQPLQRSALEAAIQAVPGVAGVTCIEYRLRDRLPNFQQMPDQVSVGQSQIIRCDNDPSRPNNGSLSVIVRGGR